MEEARAHYAAMTRLHGGNGRAPGNKAPEAEAVIDKKEEDADEVLRKEEKAKQLADRTADEAEFDILMSGTSATLVI